MSSNSHPVLKTPVAGEWDEALPPNFRVPYGAMPECAASTGLAHHFEERAPSLHRHLLAARNRDGLFAEDHDTLPFLQRF